jgi:hypothetical protein
LRAQVILGTTPKGGGGLCEWEISEEALGEFGRGGNVFFAASRRGAARGEEPFTVWIQDRDDRRQPALQGGGAASRKRPLTAKAEGARKGPRATMLGAMVAVVACGLALLAWLIVTGRVRADEGGGAVLHLPVLPSRTRDPLHRKEWESAE